MFTKVKLFLRFWFPDAPAQPAPGAEVGVVPAQEESQENPSGIESVCETVNHSGTHERVSDHNLLRVTYQVTMKGQSV